MTQEERVLLLKDLCARLPYGLKVCHINLSDEMPKVWDLIGMPAPYLADILVEWSHRFAAVNIEESIRPYLRPMSSMTEDEKEIFQAFIYPSCNDPVSMIDWLNKKMFDYRGLIEKGLAIKAPRDMYNTKIK